jgi:sugar (pentulose or hexulose) kinase
LRKPWEEPCHSLNSQVIVFSGSPCIFFLETKSFLREEREVEKKRLIYKAMIAGSRAYERFTGPQIRKLFETQTETYNSTERISLVSSFMASLLVGEYVAIDHSDGAGMNLMDIRHRTWSPEALEVG